MAQSASHAESVERKSSKGDENMSKIKVIIEKDGDPDDTVEFDANTQEEVIDSLISYIAVTLSDRVRLKYQGSGNIPRWMRFYPQD